MGISVGIAVLRCMLHSPKICGSVRWGRENAGLGKHLSAGQENWALVLALQLSHILPDLVHDLDN